MIISKITYKNGEVIERADREASEADRAQIEAQVAKAVEYAARLNLGG